MEQHVRPSSPALRWPTWPGRPATQAASAAEVRGGAYLLGVFCGQLANNALNVTLPLLLLQITHSIGLIAFVTAAGQGLDAAGTLLGGWLGRRISARTLLIVATAARFLALAPLPLLLASGSLGVPLTVGVYLLDSLARGVTDTARATIPLLLTGKDRPALERLNARYQVAFESGNLAGPFIVAGLLFALGTVVANWLAPAAFALTALIYWAVPRVATPVVGRRAVGTRPAATAGTFRVLFADRRVGLFFVSVVVLTLYPVKALLPVLFAGDVLRSPQSAAWLAGCFGVGGVLGSLLYNRLHAKVLVSTWLQWSAIGVGIFSTIFISANFFTMAAGILLFATTNVLARLATTSSLQAHLPDEAGAGILGLSRFSINTLSMVLRLLVGLAFTFSVTPKQGFSTVGIILFIFAFAQFLLSRRISSRVFDEVAADPGSRLTLFDKDPAADLPAVQRRCRNRKSGRHFYFRTMLFPMQERFAQLVDHRAMPRVLLHGSPHVHNYAASAQGAAMVDFDRSRYGPYAWDIVRFLTSLSLYREEPEDRYLAPAVLRRFREGYLRGLRQPELGYEQLTALREGVATPDSITAYLQANRRRAQELRQHPLPVDDPHLLEVLRGYLESRDEVALLDDYAVEEAGVAGGSWGCEHLLIVLCPRTPDSGRDRLLLDLKRARVDADGQWYDNPFDHQGRRMIAASELYAPGWNRRQGYATVGGHDYWGHELPLPNAKLKKPLKRKTQGELAFAVGTQLGRGHGLSLQGTSPQALEEHFLAQFAAIVAAGETIAQEISKAHARYLTAVEQGQPGERGTAPTVLTPAPDRPASAAPSPRRAAALLVAALGAALCLSLFLVMPAFFRTGALRHVDHNVAFWLHSLFGGEGPGRDLFFRVALQLGAIELVYAACVLIGLFLWQRRADPVYHVSLLLLIAGSARLMSVELKTWVGRQHAHYWSANVMLKNAFLDPHNEATKGFSYPSSQAIIAVCFFGFLIWLGGKYLPRAAALRAGWTLTMLLLIGLVGVSTLDAGIYYPSDVIGGYAFATFWLLCWLAGPALLQRWRTPRQHAPLPEATAPPWATAVSAANTAG